MGFHFLLVRLFEHKDIIKEIKVIKNSQLFFFSKIKKDEWSGFVCKILGNDAIMPIGE